MSETCTRGYCTFAVAAARHLSPHLGKQASMDGHGATVCPCHQGVQLIHGCSPTSPTVRVYIFQSHRCSCCRGGSSCHARGSIRPCHERLKTTEHESWSSADNLSQHITVGARGDLPARTAFRSVGGHCGSHEIESEGIHMSSTRPRLSLQLPHTFWLLAGLGGLYSIVRSCPEYISVAYSSEVCFSTVRLYLFVSFVHICFHSNQASLFIFPEWTKNKTSIFNNEAQIEKPWAP